MSKPTSVPDEIHQHKPPAVTVPPQLDPDLLKAEATQIALADAASGSLDVDTVLSHDEEFLHERGIDRHVERAQQEADIHLSDARVFGRALEDGVITGAVADERSIGAGDAPEQTSLDRAPLPRIDENLSDLERELEELTAAESEYTGHLSGATTDASGTDLSAPVPRTTARRWRQRKWLSKLFIVPFEGLFLFFTLRLTVNSEGRGIAQIISEALETVAVVGLSLIIVIVAPTLLSERVARLKRWPGEKEREQQQHAHDLAVVIALLTISLMLAALLAWLRAAFLSGAITEDSTIVIPYAWFLLIALVWVLAPSLFVYVLSRANHYWNHYIPDLLEVRARIAEVREALSENRVAQSLRLLRLDRQRLVTTVVLQGWEIYRDRMLPAAGAEARAEYLDQLVRAKGEPQFTDAVLVNLEARAAKGGRP